MGEICWDDKNKDQEVDDESDEAFFDNAFEFGIPEEKDGDGGQHGGDDEGGMDPGGVGEESDGSDDKCQGGSGVKNGCRFSCSRFAQDLSKGPGLTGEAHFRFEGYPLLGENDVPDVCQSV